jgi:hypothetical protein
MDHITITIEAASPEQIARALVLAENFAAHSGIQAHSGAKDHRLPLYNIVITDRLPPVAESAKAPATAAGTVPTYSLPTGEDGSIHDADRAVLLQWALRWPSTVTRVRLHAPRLGESAIVLRDNLIAVLTSQLA